MVSSTPTQPKPDPTTPEPEVPKAVPSGKKKAGGARATHVTMNIFRPIIKVFYYVFRFIGSHKLLTFLLLLLFIGSTVITNSLLTGAAPFGIGEDQWKFRVNGKSVGGDRVRAWIYALREGDETALGLLQSGLGQSAPPPAETIKILSQTKDRIWTNITVISVSQRSDTTIDSFVEINMRTVGPGASERVLYIWHFATISNGGSEQFLSIDFVGTRPLYN